LQGTKDRILPFENTAGRLEALNSNIRVVPVENGPHNIGWTFP
jgi:non-heme chloroperoxidase